tara:strand:+ start:5630 stop:6829 length:1200 start_codon:yes stop_codon:yes gene_type:complete
MTYKTKITISLALIAAIVSATFVIIKINSKETIYRINQKKAFGIVSTFVGLNGKFVGKVPLPSANCVMEEIKGRQIVYQYTDKQLVQQILVIPLTGIDEHKMKVKGFQFKVTGDDIPGYRSISEMKEKIKSTLQNKSVIIKNVKSGTYEDYGHSDKSILEKKASLTDLNKIIELGNECIISGNTISEFTDKAINEPMLTGSGPVHVSRPEVDGTFKTARKLDEYFYNINFLDGGDDKDASFLLRKKIYEQIIEKYKAEIEMSNFEEDINNYKRYLNKNSRRIAADSSSIHDLINWLSKRTVSIWYVHKQIYEQYGGAVSIKEGWLPIDGYLKVVVDYEKRGLITFPNKKAKKEFYAYYKNNNNNSNTVMDKIYYETPWWKMEKEVRALFYVEKLIDISK